MRTSLTWIERAILACALLKWAPGRRFILCWGFLVLAPVASHASTLSDAASALQPGNYMALNTGLTGDDFYPDLSDKGGSILDWADSGAWDPVRHRFYYVGKKAGCGNAYRNL